VTFLAPLLLLTLLAIPVVVIVARRIDQRRRQRVASLAGLAPTAKGGAGTDRGRAGGRPIGARLFGPLPGVLVVAAFVCFAVAVGRPQATLSLPRVEGTLLLTFDVSGSMAADDVSPSRMEAAKAAAKAIVDRQPPGVVIGVVAFSDAGLAVQPPTSDATTVLATIARLGPTHGTSLGQGIIAALDAIDEAESDTPAGYYSNRSAPPSTAPAPVPAGSHDAAAIVLFSDGENNERPDPLAAANVAANRGIRVLTIGVGTPGGDTLDLDGFRVQTALDENLLKQVAEMTDGAYQPAADLDAARVYDQLNRHVVARDEALELTALVAGVGLVLLMSGVILSIIRTGRLP
jgi:Ca-activated chloride channel family protein